MSTQDSEIGETSEYRGSPPIINNQNVPTKTNAPEPNKSYAHATKYESTPTKEQAIILQAIDGITIKEYVRAIGNILEPKAIKYISRISNGRICIYLDNKESVSKLTSKHKIIIINNESIEVRPMLTPAERIILSNIPPIIPNTVIEDVFKKNNVKLCSKITHLKAGLVDPEYSHILSFRRQVYIEPEDLKKIPESFTISQDDTIYRIFITTDKFKCFICKQEGHAAKQCPKNNETNTNSQTTDPPKDKENTTAMETEDTNTNRTGIKRPLSTTSEETPTRSIKLTDLNFKTPSLSVTTKKMNIESNKKKQKRPISPSPTTAKMEEMLEPAKHDIENPNRKYVLNYTQLKSFLENAFGSQNPIEISKEYTENTTELIEMMQKIYPLLKERGIKNRIHRLCKKLKSETPDNRSTNWSSDIDSDTS